MNTPPVRFVLAALLTCAGCAVGGAASDRTTAPDDLANVYALSVDVDPAAQRVDVRGTIEVAADGPVERAAFLLNGGLEVAAFRPDVPATVETERGVVVGTYEMPSTQRLTVLFDEPLARGDRVTIEVAYAGPIRDGSIEWGRGLVSEGWVELSLGSLWYPSWSDERALRWRLSVGVPEGYDVIGPGRVARGADGRWAVAPDGPVQGRISFAASPAFDVATRSLGGDLDASLYTAGPEPRAGEILATARDAYQYYARLLGPPRGGATRLTVAYAHEGVGVTRPGNAFATAGDYIVLGVSPPLQQAKLLAHEVAHFWWLSGESGTPDEFMTESLAEYVSLRYGQSVWGEGWLAERLDYAAKVSASVDGSLVDMGYTDGREALLYYRGPLALWELQRRIGVGVMDALLAEAYAADVSELERFVRLLGDREGAETAEWFASQL